MYLMKRVLPHVSAGQRLIEREHHRVVFGVRLMAPLSDPALVICQRVMETPKTGGENDLNHIKGELIKTKVGNCKIFKYSQYFKEPLKNTGGNISSEQANCCLGCLWLHKYLYCSYSEC